VPACEWPAIMRAYGDRVAAMCNGPLPREHARIICDNINHHDYGDEGHA
jgi:hypothetical protein